LQSVDAARDPVRPDSLIFLHIILSAGQGTGPTHHRPWTLSMSASNSLPVRAFPEHCSSSSDVNLPLVPPERFVDMVGKRMWYLLRRPQKASTVLVTGCPMWYESYQNHRSAPGIRQRRHNCTERTDLLRAWCCGSREQSNPPNQTMQGGFHRQRHKAVLVHSLASLLKARPCTRLVLA